MVTGQCGGAVDQGLVLAGALSEGAVLIHARSRSSERTRDCERYRDQSWPAGGCAFRRRADNRHRGNHLPSGFSYGRGNGCHGLWKRPRHRAGPLPAHSRQLGPQVPGTESDSLGLDLQRMTEDLLLKRRGSEGEQDSTDARRVQGQPPAHSIHHVSRTVRGQLRASVATTIQSRG